MNNVKKLYRSKTDRIIFGVCGGLGEYFEIDSLVVRILFLLLTLTGGAGIVLYLILAVIIPSEENAKSKNGNGKKMSEVVGETAQELAEEVKRKNWLMGTKNIIGLLIVLVGLNILFEQVFRFSPFSFISWGVIWALVIIFIGFKMVSR